MSWLDYMQSEEYVQWETPPSKAQDQQTSSVHLAIDLFNFYTGGLWGRRGVGVKKRLVGKGARGNLV